MMGTTGALRPGELQSSCRRQVEMFRCAAQAPPSTNQPTGERSRPIRVQVQGNYDCGQDVTGGGEEVFCSPNMPCIDLASLYTAAVMLCSFVLVNDII